MATRNAIKSRRLQTFIIVTSSVFLYLATLTADYYWDGITFALQIEKVARMERGAFLLFHQNHLIYEALGYACYGLMRFLSVPIRALYLLQVMNVFAAAAAIAVFFRLAENVSQSRYASVISSMALAVSAVWWKVATDANAYVISILLMLGCASTLLGTKPRWLLAALALAGAMLVHQLAALFYPAALVAIHTNPSTEKKWKFAVKFSALAWGTTISIYYLCACLLHDLKNPIAVVKWAASNPSGVSPSANPLQGLAMLPRGTVDMVVGHSFALFRSQGGWVEKMLASAAVVSAVLCLVLLARKFKLADFPKNLLPRAPQKRERFKVYAPMLVTWIGAYILFLLFWEPWQTLYRAFYLPAFALTFAILLGSYDGNKRSWLTVAPALATVTLGLFNLAFFIAPHMRATANPLVAAARNMNHVWTANTVVYFAYRNEADTAFEYFNNQTEWRRLTTATQAGIDDELQRATLDGGGVWLNKGAIELIGNKWLAPRTTGREIVVESPNALARYVELLRSH